MCLLLLLKGECPPVHLSTDLRGELRELGEGLLLPGLALLEGVVLQAVPGDPVAVPQDESLQLVAPAVMILKP